LLLLLVGMFPGTAAAAPVVVMEPGGHVRAGDDPFLAANAAELAPATGTPRASRALHGPRSGSAHQADSGRTVYGELAKMLHSRALSSADYHRYTASFTAALRAVRRLGGTRAAELQSIVSNLHAIAANGLLTPSRLPALFLTLDRNRQWWTTGSLLSSGQRVEFAGSELVWEYYAGQGIELQPLGSFGKADGFYTGGRSYYPRLKHILAELIPLAAKRGGGSTWEYYFSFGGGTPPWTSAMSQGTALEALTRGYKAFHDRSYLDVARAALPIFHASPPLGVSVRTGRGVRYVLYSFAPGSRVINGFLQTLIGLVDYARASGNQEARKLFEAGDAEARAEVPGYDTGAWSLYEPGQEDSLDYHNLVTGFLHQLCARTSGRVYCTTASHFDSYLKTPPALRMLTQSVPRHAGTSIRFWLSKASHVGIVVVYKGTTVFLTSADFSYGVSSFSIPPLAHKGSYTVRLAATDLAGNFHRIIGAVAASG
jgi:hypothetical protein